MPTANVDTINSADVNISTDLVVTGNIVANSITADINFDDFTPQMPTRKCYYSN